MIILAGDIGGTKTRLQLSRYQTDEYSVIKKCSYASNDYSDFNLIILDFISDINTEISAVCFGVAGPINNDIAGDTQAQVTNLPWQLASHALAKLIKVKKVNLINDFQSVGHGLTELHSNDLFELQAGTPQKQGNLLVIGAGTGLGVAQLVWIDSHYKIIATEGGHAAFSPSSQIEAELSSYLLKKYGYTSIEQVLSGPGLVNIYQFLCHNHQTETGTEQFILNSSDKAAAIAHHAEIEPNSISAQALAIFIHLYGSHVGDFCLTSFPTGGVYIAGGIAPKILQHIRHGSFMQAFANKGKMAGIMKNFPLKVIINPNAGLIGSRKYARLNS